MEGIASRLGGPLRDSKTLDDDVIEAIINAPAIYKTLRSTSGSRAKRRERLYVILGTTHDGIVVYTKGTVRRQAGRDVFYVLISAKRALRGNS